MRIQLRGVLTMNEVLRARRLLRTAPGCRRLELDLSEVRDVSGDAVAILEADLEQLAASGVRVTLQRISRRVRRRLKLHPILRFTSEWDDLITDPDLDWSGFRPSLR